MTPLEEVEALLGAANENCQLRTVISRAYYASFRRLIGVCTPLGFQQSINQAQGSPHLGIHARLRGFTASSNAAVLRRIGHQLLPDLYKLRIKADYSFTTLLTRSEAEEAVALATDIEDWIADAGLASHVT